MNKLGEENDMVLAEIENHREMPDSFLQDARREYERGDLPQAAEKAWGAVAHCLKSEAKFRGWRSESHRDLIDISHDLAFETSDPREARLLFAVAMNMHVNICDDWHTDLAVSVGIDASEKLVSLFEARTGPEICPRPSQIERRNRTKPRGRTR